MQCHNSTRTINHNSTQKQTHGQCTTVHRTARSILCISTASVLYQYCISTDTATQEKKKRLVHIKQIAEAEAQYNRGKLQPFNMNLIRSLEMLPLCLPDLPARARPSTPIAPAFVALSANCWAVKPLTRFLRNLKSINPAHQKRIPNNSDIPELYILIRKESRKHQVSWV